MIELLQYNDEIKEVLIYGGTFWGRLVSHELKSKGVRIRGIFDKNLAGEEIEGLEVRAPEEIRNYDLLPVIVCSTRGLRSMCDFLEGIGYQRAYHAGQILGEADWSVIQGWDIYDREEMTAKYMKYVQDYRGDDPEKIELGELNVIVTERCNLRCDMCLARSPDMKSGKVYPVDGLIESFEKFLAQIHCLYKIIICGGEPLLHPQLHRLVDFCAEQEKIKRIEVLSNATIIPKEELLKSLAQEKVRFVLDDYELPFQKIREITEICEAHGVNCQVKKLEYWHDLTVMREPKNSSEAELVELYRECTESQNYTIVDEKIVNCYRTFVDRQCGDWPESICDYFIDLKAYEKGDKGLKDAMLKLMSRKYIERCKYCVGTGKNAKVIPVAEQR